MLKSEKTEQIKALRSQFDRMTSAVFLDFTGMTVEEVTNLRNTFRKSGVEYKVVKNTLVTRALADKPWVNKLDDVLVGMTGVAWSFEEPSAAARALKEFKKSNEKLKIKAGLLEGQVIGPQAVETQLATLPNKDEARAMFLATLLAAPQRFVMLLNAPARNFVGVLAAKQRNEGG